ncbi:MAG: 23S rRNA (pseudouridine(1915)-N(3))-methyltransferase RlmH [Hyphomonadaceae bacterium]|nr:23S rRNA (pseudouridine(1915)-N(3))-methyltransferase RlmH [Hyphomonadaceae bacterium]
MRIQIVAVGRLKNAPEAALVEDYLKRANAAGKRLSLAIDLAEVESKPPGDDRKEAVALFQATPDDSYKVLCDERGSDLSSRQLAQKITAWRDQGRACVTFWIGGADGASQSVKDQADEKLAFGRQTWPHRLVRVMLAEQIYRVSMIMSQTPYHRD